MNYTFNNSSIVSVNSGTIVLNVSGKTRTFADAKLVSAVDGKIVLDLPKYAIKNGQYLVIQLYNKAERVFIANPYRKCCIDVHVSQCDDQIVYNGFWTNSFLLRNATPEEIQELNDQLASEGKQWNPNTMQIEKLRWKPKKGEQYFYIRLGMCYNDVESIVWIDNAIDIHLYESGNCFRTEKQAEAKLEKIKKLLLEV